MSTSTSVNFTWNPIQSVLTASSDAVSYGGGLTRDGVAGALPDGTYSITLSYQNSMGDPAATAMSTSVVVDATAPVITRVGSDPVTVSQGATYTDEGATASDVRQGNLTSSIVVTNPVDTNTVNSYTVRYNVSDSAGNAASEVTRTVNVVVPTPTPTATATSTAIPTMTPTPVPLAGSVVGSLSPSASNILIFVHRYDLDKSEEGYAEGSCLTIADGSFSCPVSTAGYYLVRPRNTDYVFNPTEAVMPSGIVNGAFTATSQPVTVTGCSKADRSITIQRANSAANNLYKFLGTSLTSANALAQRVRKASQRTKLVAVIQSLEAKSLVNYSAAIKSTEGLPPIVLSCNRNPACNKVSYSNQRSVFQRNVRSLGQLLATLAREVGKIDKGSALATRISTKQATLLKRALASGAKLPTRSFSCS